MLRAPTRRFAHADATTDSVRADRAACRVQQGRDAAAGAAAARRAGRARGTGGDRARHGTGHARTAGTGAGGTNPAGAGARRAGCGRRRGEGEDVYKQTCAACHAAGVAGAPKLGDSADWQPRIAQGKDVLYEHSIKGFSGKKGVMPPKGGNLSLSDDQVKAAVDYMVSQAK